MLLFVFCYTQHSYQHKSFVNKVITLVEMVKVIVKIVTTSNMFDQTCQMIIWVRDEGLLM